MKTDGRKPVPTISAIEPGSPASRDSHKLDNATDKVKAEAEEAHLFDRSATLSVLADAERALKRVVRRAEALSGKWERVEIAQDRGPSIDFTGRMLAETSFETRGHRPLTLTLEIWETRAGALVAVTASALPGGTGREDVRATVIEPSEDVQAMRFAVMDAFEWENRARSMVTKKLNWSLRMEVE